jgi:hypothetical protein
MARPAFVVNDAMRERVRYLAGVGVRQDDIAKIIIERHGRRATCELVSRVKAKQFLLGMGGGPCWRTFSPTERVASE